MDKSIEVALLPEGETLLNAALDVCHFYASMVVTENAGNKC